MLCDWNQVKPLLEDRSVHGYIDTPFLIKTKGADEILQEYGKIMLEYDGIPHWGKINDVLNENTGLLEKYYPMLGEWKKVNAGFNPSRVFSNDFTDRLGLTGKN